MILYNVTVKIKNEVKDDWLQWMKETHIPDVMNTGLFEEHKLLRIFDEDTDGSTYAIQYFCKDMDTFNKYQADHAKALQADHMKRYDKQYMAFRTLMEVIG